MSALGSGMLLPCTLLSRPSTSNPSASGSCHPRRVEYSKVALKQASTSRAISRTEMLGTYAGSIGKGCKSYWQCPEIKKTRAWGNSSPQARNQKGQEFQFIVLAR